MKEGILTLEETQVGHSKVKFNVYLFVKRTIDIVASLIGMFFLLPIYLIVKIVYVLNGDFDKVMFAHKRIGKNGKEFNMYKFRTMVPNALEILDELLKDPKYLKEWQENHKFEHDPRITKIGNILRKTSLDELPQFINIFLGNMSLIGPRPMIKEEVDDYGKRKLELLSVRPGLTGWWACNGRSCTSAEERKELELYYVKNCSMKLDIKIVFKTVIAVLKKEGAK